MKKNKLFKVTGIILGVVAGIAIIGSVAMGAFVTDQILYQNREKDTVAASLKQLETWEYDVDSFYSKYKGKDFVATAEDGNEAPGTYFENGSDKCVVLVHGAGGDRVCMVPLAEQYLDDGYDVIIYDQRGHGANPDEKVTFGIHELRDVKAMVEYARQDLGKDKVYVHGQSMGGQTVALYASSVTPGTVQAADAVICDSPVPGMELLLRLMFGDGEEGAHSAFTNYLIDTSKAYMGLVKKIKYDDGDTIKLVAKDQLPTMIIVSDKDEVCPPKYVEQVYENVGSEKKEIMHVDSAHVEGVIDDAKGYMEGVEQFLDNL